jgi:uncharacterized alpha-E superfamily protein
MLSRIAESLYWMGRYTERAEGTARLLDVSVRASLEGSDMVGPKVLAAVLGGAPPEVLASAQPENPGARVELLRHYSLARDSPPSLAFCVREARENARTVRDAVTSEMWEALNTWHLQVAAAGPDELTGGGAYAFLSAMKARSFLFSGVTDATMLREEGWHWLVLGRYLERVVFTVRLLGARAGMLDAGQEAGARESYGFAVLLRSLSAYEAFRSTYRAGVDPYRVAEFLLLDPNLPRSALYSACRVEEAMAVITDADSGVSRPARRLAGRVRALLEYRQVEEIFAEGVEVFLARLAVLCADLHNSLGETSFARGVQP